MKKVSNQKFDLTRQSTLRLNIIAKQLNRNIGADTVTPLTRMMTFVTHLLTTGAGAKSIYGGNGPVGSGAKVSRRGDGPAGAGAINLSQGLASPGPGPNISAGGWPR